MAYKTRFQPLEGLVAEQWVRLTGAEDTSQETER
jgi:arginyl-tRNA--protein-N-Asp/Glu arginylyltransferase